MYMYMYVPQVRWGKSGSTEEGNKLTKAKVSM